MKRRVMWPLQVAGGLMLILAGCVTVPEGEGGSVFGRSAQPSAPSPQQLADARRDSRLAEAEQSLNRIRHEVDAVGESLSRVSARNEAFSRQFDARSADHVALRNEVAALRAEVESLKGRVDAVPGTLSRLLDEHGKAIRADVSQEIQRQVRAASASSGRPRTGSRSGRYYEHEVGPGQTLSEIAQVYGVSVDVIISENKIQNPSLIRAGQKLLIPAD